MKQIGRIIKGGAARLELASSWIGTLELLEPVTFLNIL